MKVKQTTLENISINWERKKRKDEYYFAKMKDQNIFNVKDQGLNLYFSQNGTIIHETYII